MADLISEQLDTIHRIKRIVDNLKKKGAANITPGLVQSRLDALEKLWVLCEDNHRELKRDTSEKVVQHEYFHENLFDQAEEAYLDQRGVLLDYLRKAETMQASAGKSVPVTPSTSASDSRARAVLPRIELPVFEGQFEKWHSFRDLFTSLIIQDPSLKDVERFHYLKTCVKGEAAMLLSNMPVTDASFKRAWTSLTERFQNKRLLVRAQLDALSSLPKVKRESATDLKRLLYGTWDIIGALAEIGRPVTNATDWIVYLTAERLDSRSRREWEVSLGASTEPPSLADLKQFLETRIHTVEALESRGGEELAVTKKSSRVHQVTAEASANKDCELCGRRHYILFCSRYREMRPAERKAKLVEFKRCLNCLGKHLVSACSSQKRCQQCSERHHTSIHEEKEPTSGAAVQHVFPSRLRECVVALGMARLHVYSPAGQRISARALIDPGSEVTLIAEQLVTRLGLPRTRARVPLSFVSGASSQTTRGWVTLQASSTHNPKERLKFPALVLNKLSDYKPHRLLTDKLLPQLPDLPWADPYLSSQDPVELLLGADVYSDLILDGVWRGGSHLPVAQETRLGWILTGSLSLRGSSSGPADQIKTVQLCTSPDLGSLLERFWEQEEVFVASPLTAADQECEEHFKATHTRTSEGRFMVRLPFKDKPELGISRPAALRVLESTERRLKGSAELGKAYRDFLQEYEHLGHMTAARSLPGDQHYYLPHHGVLRPESATTRLRVVFNGSMPASSGKSLNEFLHSGANLLPAIADILLRWRLHRIAFAVDIEKMFRQIWVHPADRDFQRILWRSHPSTRVKEYQLNTVTYGLACAPYLAQRCLRQLAINEAERYPNASRILSTDVYMDDILSGADSPSKVDQLREELAQLCKAGGFTLHKWASNRAIPEGRADSHGGEKEWNTHTHQSVLGLIWSPESDSFQVKVLAGRSRVLTTKRTVLSQAAQIFDPLGWLSPITVVAKMFIQTLWKLKADWDEELPERERAYWDTFLGGLPALQSLQSPRWLGLWRERGRCQVHGFCDASERAYAAVVYFRTEDPLGHLQTRLLAAKTKVAPLKQVSLPRLELCGALLLARLAAHLIKTLDLTGEPIHLWTDSSVTLGWIQAHPSRWQTYVANRVAEIQHLLPDACWHHVKGSENPADCASRGLPAVDLAAHTLWWSGPTWVTDEDNWPLSEVQAELPLPEQRRAILHTRRTEEIEVNTFFERFSNLRRLLRVTAWCCRWLPPLDAERANYLTAREIVNAERRLIRLIQEEHFKEEIAALRRGRPLSSRSRLVKLTPFLDADDVLRVGGRLQAADLDQDQQHPVIIPDGSHFTELLIRDAHQRSIHGGVQLTLAMLRQRYWLLRGRQSVKASIHRCLRCLRWRGSAVNQLMGPLPSARVNASRAFLRVGVDYAGPILLRKGGGRGYKAYKGYIALFVCLATRAVHLEVVSDATTEAFLAALRRFVSRRGRCSQIFSDCGTVFVGANRELQGLAAIVNQQNHAFTAALADERIEWRFNPPAAPHFGGIWEAAVKSAKHHLRRVLGEQTLTFEEMTTLLAQIEACLNSRPLQPLSDDPQDLQALTPGHFLIGAPLTAIPEIGFEELPVNRLSRWQLIQQLQQSFWRRWSQEYLQSLQPRGKWLKTQPVVRKGDLCLIKSEIQPPSRWPLARVTKLLPGSDGLTRVVELRTALSTLTRPVNKLIRLPVVDTDEPVPGSSPPAST